MALGDSEAEKWRRHSTGPQGTKAVQAALLREHMDFIRVFICFIAKIGEFSFKFAIFCIFIAKKIAYVRKKSVILQSKSAKFFNMKTTIQNIAGYMLGGVMFVVLVPEEEEELMPMQSSRGTRFKMSLNVGVQPNLLFGLVLNERTGDEIKARGEGAITIGYDDQTEIISMLGTYTVQSGTMGFTVGNMIRRIIWRPRIHWKGGRYNPSADVVERCVKKLERRER